MMQSYVISVVDPTYRTEHVIGVFDKRLTKRIMKCSTIFFVKVTREITRKLGKFDQKLHK
jgi:hypothetical protein